MGATEEPQVEPTIDVVGVGNAIVDVLASVDDSFILEHGLTKGSMTLIDAERAAVLHAAMPPGIVASGGSAANTRVGVAAFGGRAAYIGKVRDDDLGEVFRRDLRAAGVAFDVPGATDGESTARCLIQVTADAQRTLNTFLGVSAHLGPDSVDADLVAVAGELKGRNDTLAIVLVVTTLALSWLFSNMVYAMHYAHLFYSADDDGEGDAGGIDFPGCKEPDYWDFLYFSATLGMTFQTSDVSITSRRIRRVVLGQCLAAFVFNLGVIAFTINVLGGGGN